MSKNEQEKHLPLLEEHTAAVSFLKKQASKFKIQLSNYAQKKYQNMKDETQK